MMPRARRPVCPPGGGHVRASCPHGWIRADSRSMRTAIVGFAGSGKTTVFNSLTGLAANTGYGAKDKANLGLIRVPDSRVDFLTGMYAPKKTTLAEIVFVDVAGPPGESTAVGLETAVIEHIQ